MLCAAAIPTGIPALCLRVFIVEDGLDMQAALRALLDPHAGFQVVGTATGRSSATVWLRRHAEEWDVVSLELVLNDGGGFNLIRLSKALRPRGIVVVFSEFVTESIREHCLALGADAVFSKSQVADYSDFMHAIRDPAAR